MCTKKSAAENELENTIKGEASLNEIRENNLTTAITLNSMEVTPAVIYPNADLDKERILAENLRVICVYRWVNKINGNIYVGSTINLRVRLYTYFSLGSLSKSKRIIDKALLKYGYSNFSFEILEYCTRENVLVREQYYMDLLNPVYNIVEKAGSTLGYKHSDEVREKMRNLKISDEVLRVKLQSVAKATEANKVKVLVVNIKTKEEKEYSSITEAGVALGVHKNTIGNAIKNKRVVQNKFICLLNNEKESEEKLAERILSANLKLDMKPGETSKVKVIVENINTLERREYSSMAEASKVLGVHKTNIGKAINKKSIVKKSYICYLHTVEHD